MWKEAGRASQQELQAQGLPGTGTHSWKSGGWMGWVRLGSTGLYEEK